MAHAEGSAARATQRVAVLEAEVVSLAAQAEGSGAELAAAQQVGPCSARACLGMPCCAEKEACAPPWCMHAVLQGVMRVSHWCMRAVLQEVTRASQVHACCTARMMRIFLERNRCDIRKPFKQLPLLGTVCLS